MAYKNRNLFCGMLAYDQLIKRWVLKTYFLLTIYPKFEVFGLVLFVFSQNGFFIYLIKEPFYVK